MSQRLAVGLTALGLFALLIAFAIPPAIDASQSTTNDTFVIGENDTRTVTDGLNVTLENSTDSEATVLLFDVESGVSHTVELAENSTSDVTINSENVTVRLAEGDATDTEAQLTVEYSPRYGWDDGAKAVAGQMDVILLLMAFALLGGGMGAVRA